MTMVLEVQNLGKSYQQWGSNFRRIFSWFHPGIRPLAENWVLEDISFSVESGEAVGIIGQNGAGKSTLLKLITGTVFPTKGSVKTIGQVSAILELGMGFNPELTGRQNAYHAAGLLGYSYSDIENNMSNIESFAEIGDYFDQPVRTYSSGMQMRVAFSVATSFRPAILIVDEALSVGDSYFQQKCFQRIREFSKKGTTLLFVTHDIVGILEICSRAIYLRKGQMVFDGNPQKAVSLYQKDVIFHSAIPSNDTESMKSPSNLQGAEGSLITPDVSCLAVNFYDENNNNITTITSETRVTLAIKYQIHRFLNDPHVGFKILNRLGNVIFETNTYCMGRTIGPIEKNKIIETYFNFPMDLAPGNYTIIVGMANEGYDMSSFKEHLSYLTNIMTFTMIPNTASITWSGIINIHPKVDWSILSTISRQQGSEMSYEK